MATDAETKHQGETTQLSLWERAIIYPALLTWAAVFLIGTLVDSSPFRATFSSFEGPLEVILRSGAIVFITYTYTNTGILCLLAGFLGTIGRRSRLGPELPQSDRDPVNPRTSAVLRGFLVYLAFLAGVLVFGDNPVEPTQTQYIRLAGLISLLSFIVNARPSIFGQLLGRMSGLFEPARTGS